MADHAPLTAEELAAIEADADMGLFIHPTNTGRLIADLRAARDEVERLRRVDLQQIAAGVLTEYGLHQEDVFHAATLIAERAELPGKAHDEPNCDPSVDCKFVGPRDCPCRCHATDGAVAAGYESWMGDIADRLAADRV